MGAHPIAWLRLFALLEHHASKSISSHHGERHMRTAFGHWMSQFTTLRLCAYLTPLGNTIQRLNLCRFYAGCAAWYAHALAPKCKGLAAPSRRGRAAAQLPLDSQSVCVATLRTRWVFLVLELLEQCARIQVDEKLSESAGRRSRRNGELLSKRLQNRDHLDGVLLDHPCQQESLFCIGQLKLSQHGCCGSNEQAFFSLLLLWTDFAAAGATMLAAVDAAGVAVEALWL
eukprot:TRINITY_DN5160_c0_g2_i6.p1 TRINITY_DN5160_c0_g2~~TRINITY_DN5160_c0_g2_i6.p1  ORF type:complete len:229 (-),score=27.52 TRINITY_DN5160_c0_g2_i6:470-1156(-)